MNKSSDGTPFPPPDPRLQNYGDGAKAPDDGWVNGFLWGLFIGVAVVVLVIAFEFLRAYVTVRVLGERIS